MAKNYDETDMVWTKRGDLALSNNGDIADTLEDPLRSIYQEFLTRSEGSKRDWNLYPQLGAQVSDFIGEPNTKETAEAIKVRILAALTFDGLFEMRDIKITYAPIDIDKIMFRASINTQPTARNRGTETLSITFVYSYSENNIYQMENI